MKRIFDLLAAFVAHPAGDWIFREGLALAAFALASAAVALTWNR